MSHYAISFITMEDHIIVVNYSLIRFFRSGFIERHEQSVVPKDAPLPLGCNAMDANLNPDPQSQSKVNQNTPLRNAGGVDPEATCCNVMPVINPRSSC